MPVIRIQDIAFEEMACIEIVFGKISKFYIDLQNWDFVVISILNFQIRARITLKDI